MVWLVPHRCIIRDSTPQCTSSYGLSRSSASECVASDGVLHTRRVLCRRHRYLTLLHGLGNKGTSQVWGQACMRLQIAPITCSTPQEDSARKQEAERRAVAEQIEAERRATEQYKANLDKEVQAARALAEAEGRIKENRENQDINRRRATRDGDPRTNSKTCPCPTLHGVPTSHTKASVTIRCICSC